MTDDQKMLISKIPDGGDTWREILVWLEFLNSREVNMPQLCKYVYVKVK